MSNLEHNVLTYGSVGLFKEQLQGVPVLDRKFCLDLFGDPYNTDCGVTPRGFEVFRTSPGITPTFSVGPGRIQIVCFDVEMVGEVLDKVWESLKTWADAVKQSIEITTVGLNTEHEWKGFSQDAMGEISRRFFAHITGAADNKLLVQDLKFSLGSGDRLYNCHLQSRAGEEKGLYLAVNDHRAWDEDAFDGATIRRLLQESAEAVAATFSEVFLQELRDDAAK